MQLWYRLLPQEKTILNLIRQSRSLLYLSAYTHIFGEFDFNRTPLAPPRTQVFTHNRPNNHASWAPLGEYGCYMGPAMEHYRFHKACIPKTKIPQYSPYPWTQPKHGKTIRLYQKMHQLKNWMTIIKKRLHTIVGKFLYDSISVHPTTLMALESLAVV